MCHLPKRIWARGGPSLPLGTLHTLLISASPIYACNLFNKYLLSVQPVQFLPPLARL